MTMAMMIKIMVKIERLFTGKDTQLKKKRSSHTLQWDGMLWMQSRCVGAISLFINATWCFPIAMSGGIFNVYFTLFFTFADCFYSNLIRFTSPTINKQFFSRSNYGFYFFCVIIDSSFLHFFIVRLDKFNHKNRSRNANICHFYFLYICTNTFSYSLFFSYFLWTTGYSLKRVLKVYWYLCYTI